MIDFARFTVLVVTMTGCVGCDQVTKVAARTCLGTGAAMSFLNDTVRLQHTENPGAFLSLGDTLPEGVRTLIFTAGGAVLVGGAIVWAIRSRRMGIRRTVAAALVCGGGLGNLIDRLTRHGYVTDFLNVGIGPLRTGIFNVADVVLLIGVALLVLSRTGGTAGPSKQ